jgi:lycopene cyclase domain-containing protein
MTYFGFIVRFLLVPLVLLGALTLWDLRRGKRLIWRLNDGLEWAALAVLGAVALLYTTPWDNYLVATRVWWYDPVLVAGITLGWVPVEEYLFFVLQTLVTGLWLLFLARRWPVTAHFRSCPRHLRWILALIVGFLWLGAVMTLIAGWRSGNYLGLQLAWGLPPLILQLAYGADVLWRYRRLVLLAWLPPTLYLCIADALAISSGTWTVNPARSLNLYLAGQLPVEEATFFLLTNMLIVFGMVLLLVYESRRHKAVSLGPVFARSNQI